MKSAQLAMLCLPSVGLLACGDDGGGPVALEDIQPRIIEVLCKSQVKCGAVPDQTTCRAMFPTDEQLMADVRAGSVKYDGKAAGECLGFLKSATDNCSRTKRFNIEFPGPACDATFGGTVAEGGACMSNEWCLSRKCDRGGGGCDSGNSCCVGICVATPPQIPIDGVCTGSDTCVKGASCRSSAATGRSFCQPRAGIGEPCANPTDCVATAACIRKRDGSSGVCSKPALEGEACDGDARDACDPFANFCDPVTSTCRHTVSLGAACSSDDACPAFARCDAATSTCKSQANIGEPCIEAVGDCIEGLRCAAGTCASPSSVVCPQP